MEILEEERETFCTRDSDFDDTGVTWNVVFLQRSLFGL